MRPDASRLNATSNRNVWSAYTIDSPNAYKAVGAPGGAPLSDQTLALSLKVGSAARGDVTSPQATIATHNAAASAGNMADRDITPAICVANFRGLNGEE